MQVNSFTPSFKGIRHLDSENFKKLNNMYGDNVTLFKPGELIAGEAKPLFKESTVLPLLSVTGKNEALVFTQDKPRAEEMIESLFLQKGIVFKKLEL